MSSPIGRVVIAGASVAGLSAADTLREEGYEGSITVLSAESELPYDRPPLSKQALDPRSEPRDFRLRPDEHYSEAGIDLRLGSPAIGLDASASTVETEDGPVEYDRLIIATGSRAKRLHTLEGTPLPNVRTAADCRSLREQAKVASSAVVIGTGFIGLEVAATLRSAGLQVTTVGFYPLPLDRSVGPEIAQMIRDLHLDNGVEMHGGCQVLSIEGAPGRYLVELSNGTKLSAEMVLAGIGAQPNIEWLEGSGLDITDGIKVDGWGRSNLPGVLAAGDVAAFDNPLIGGHVRVEHWTSAVEQGRQAALTALEKDVPALMTVPYFWTDQFGRKIQSYGRRRPTDIVYVVEGSLEERDFLAVHGGQDGSFSAVTACGRPASVRPYRKLLQERASLEQALALTGAQSMVSIR